MLISRSNRASTAAAFGVALPEILSAERTSPLLVTVGIRFLPLLTLTARRS
jgi:hypothetical protein